MPVPAPTSSRRLATLLGVALAVLASLGLPQVAAAALPPSITMVGASCGRPLFLFHQSGELVASAEAAPAHAGDDLWVQASVVETALPTGRRSVTVSWKASAGVELCPTSVAKIGYGGDFRLQGAAGQVQGEVSARGPVRVRLRARFTADVDLRRLGARRLRAVVGGWSRRACTLRTSDPGAASVLERVAGRAGTEACAKAPAVIRPSVSDLVRNLTAFVNGPAERDRAVGREYYRVLRQLTTFGP